MLVEWWISDMVHYENFIIFHACEAFFFFFFLWLLKRSMILLKGLNLILLNQIATTNIHINNSIF